jgi:hypothetical protein
MPAPLGAQAWDLSAFGASCSDRPYQSRRWWSLEGAAAVSVRCCAGVWSGEGWTARGLLRLAGSGPDCGAVCRMRLTRAGTRTVRVTSDLACPVGRVGRMSLRPSTPKGPTAAWVLTVLATPAICGSCGDRGR